MGRCKYSARHTDRDAFSVPSPFARPGSHAGSARSEEDFPSAAPQAARSSSCNSTISSIDDPVFPPDANTSTSWEVIDPACDEEVAGITNRQSQHQVNGPANIIIGSDPSNQDPGLEQVSDINSANNLGTLYNQDFFIADMTNRRLSQIPDKTSTISHSPFARPGSRAGASTVPATPTGMPSASPSPFAWPGSHAGSARSEVDFPSAAPQAARSSSCNSTISSIDDPVFPPDANTSTSWEVIDPACDEEVTGITNGQSQHQVNGPANIIIGSDPSNQDPGLEQVSDINSANNLGTLYNQDFFVADTTNRRLSQIPDKTNYPYPLPNGHAALQLRLPDLLIYLKTDTYLMDVNTGEHYAVYSDKNTENVGYTQTVLRLGIQATVTHHPE